jgi:hypothetical protein
LELTFLEADGRPIAFGHGMTAKGVYHSCKIGYDPQYARYAPGQLLRFYHLQQMHGEPDRRAVDFMGPMTEAHALWRPATYPVGRTVIAPKRLSGRLALYAYQRWWPIVRRWRGAAAVGSADGSDVCPIRSGRSPDEYGQELPEKTPAEPRDVL